MRASGRGGGASLAENTRLAVCNFTLSLLLHESSGRAWRLNHDLLTMQEKRTVNHAASALELFSYNLSPCLCCRCARPSTTAPRTIPGPNLSRCPRRPTRHCLRTAMWPARPPLATLATARLRRRWLRPRRLPRWWLRPRAWRWLRPLRLPRWWLRPRARRWLRPLRVRRRRQGHRCHRCHRCHRRSCRRRGRLCRRRRHKLQNFRHRRHLLPNAT